MVEADLVNVSLICQLDHDLKLFHLDIQRVVVFAEKDLQRKGSSKQSVQMLVKVLPRSNNSIGLSFMLQTAMLLQAMMRMTLMP